MLKAESRNKKIGVKVLLILLVIAILLGILIYIQENYTIKTVYVNGNFRYTQQEIEDIIMTGPLGRNSIYLSFTYKNKEMTSVPFLDAIDVTVLNSDTIRIQVYEKALAGYIVCLGQNIYFDKDGTVIDSTSIKMQGIPEITGLKYSQIVMGEKLVVEGEDTFSKILEITKVLAKYDLVVDKMHFDKDDNIILYFKGVRVILNDDILLNTQAERLKEILPKVMEKSGVLNLFDENNIYFKED